MIKSYEVAQTLRTRHKHESIRLNYGSLYGVVKNLDRTGLIEPVGISQEGRRPKRTTYRITDAGRLEMRSWLAELIAQPGKEFLQFEAGLSLMAALPPEDVIQLLRRRVRTLQHQIENGREQLEQDRREYGLSRLHIIEAEYTFGLLEWEMTWIHSLLEDLESGALEDLDAWRGWVEEAERQSQSSSPAGPTAPSKQGKKTEDTQEETNP
jgi:DNA-binding PadR family transcriptional regulator